MTVTISVAVANAMLDAWETAIGTSPVMKIRSGAPPANCAAASTGTVGATLALPSDFMGAASNNVKSKSGTWEDTAADATITAGHYEILTSGGVVSERGTVTVTGGGGDMEVDNVSFNAGQAFTITAFSHSQAGV